MVSIEEDPSSIDSLFLFPDILMDTRLKLGISDLPQALFDSYRQRAQTAMNRRLGPNFKNYIVGRESEKGRVEDAAAHAAWEAKFDEDWQRNDETRLSLKIPTTLRPLGVSATAALLRHGYLNCMNSCSLLLEGFPRFDDPPSMEEMRQLARGLPRQRHPTLPDSGAKVS